MKAFVRSRSAFLFVSNFPPILHSSPPPRFIHRVSRISLSFSLPKNSFGCHNNRAERIHETVIPALCEDSHRDVYVYPPSLSLSLSLSTAHSSPATPPRLSHPLATVPPLFLAAVHCLSPQFLRLSIVLPLFLSLPSPSSPPSPPLAPSAGRSRRSFAPLSSALRFSLRLAESSFLPDPPPCIFGRWIRRNGSTTPFVPELGRVRMRRLTSTGENRD